MAHTWKYVFGLGLLGAALAAGCTVKEGDDDDNGGASGEGGSTGGSSAKGGTGGTAAGKGGSGGTGGSAAGKGGAGGSSGATTGGTGGTGTGGTTAEGGAAGVTEGGTGGAAVEATCDPDNGDPVGTPSDTCAPLDGATGDSLKCQECMQDKCCAETKACYGEDPYNVCGWGGPASGEYEGYSEIGCYVDCLRDAVAANDMTCDQASQDSCAEKCATTKCIQGGFALLGNATSDLVSCVQTNCSDKCFGADVADACAN